MSDFRVIATIVHSGSWGKPGQSLIIDRDVIEVRNKNWLVEHQGLIQRTERIPKTPIIRGTIEWPDPTRAFVDSESTAVYGLARDMVLAGFVKADSLPKHSDLRHVYCIVLDPGHADEVLAVYVQPWPFECAEDQ